MTALSVVTGGAGFIGSHLVELLRSQGQQVRIVDNLSTGRRALLPPGVEFLEGDVNDVAESAVRGAEVVYHLAALPSVPRSIEWPVESHRATGEGVLAILRAAEKAGVRRVVYASSSSVYGDTPVLPKRETMPPRPLSPYAVAKLSGEYYARWWGTMTRLETVALRFFNVYGPRQDPDSPYAAVIPIFLRLLRAGRPMPVNGDGGQTRDFTFVGDVVRGVVAAGGAPGVSGRVYNLAGGKPISVKEMGEALAQCLGVPAHMEFRPHRPGDIRDSFADVEAARRELGFEARVALGEGLRATVGPAGP